MSNSPALVSQPQAVCPSLLVRARILKRLRMILSSDPKGSNHAAVETIALLNWARELPAKRGFSLAKRVEATGRDHGRRVLLELLSGNRLTKRLDELIADETNEASAWAHADLRRWTMKELRTEWMERFNALPEGTPDLQWLLATIARNTPHGPSNALEHGEQASVYFQSIALRLRQIAGETITDRRAMGGSAWQRLPSLKMPSWSLEPTHATWLLEAISKVDQLNISRYLTHHDGGKAFCMTLDLHGKPHYPDHAEVSARVWSKAGGSELECELMRKDMFTHTMSAADCPVFAQDPLAPVLLLSALAEVHANTGPIFGGFDSPSFCAKFKQLERRGNALLKIWLAR